MKEILKESSQLDYLRISRIYNNIGFSYYKLNDLESALNYYKQALKIDGNYVVCLNNVAAVFLNQKKYREALTYLTHAYTQDGNNVKVSFNLFVAHANLENKESAKFYLGRAFEIDEDYTIERLKRNGLTDKQIKKIRNLKLLK
jgi:tetratricopeptide (TPR) repeat protein